MKKGEAIIEAQVEKQVRNSKAETWKISLRVGYLQKHWENPGFYLTKRENNIKWKYKWEKVLNSTERGKRVFAVEYYRELHSNALEKKKKFLTLWKGNQEVNVLKRLT